MGRPSTYCIHCWTPLSQSEGPVCSYCGKLCLEMPGRDYYLRPLTILHGRYLAGTALGQGGFGVTGQCDAEDRKNIRLPS